MQSIKQEEMQCITMCEKFKVHWKRGNMMLGDVIKGNVKIKEAGSVLESVMESIFQIFQMDI